MSKSDTSVKDIKRLKSEILSDFNDLSVANLSDLRSKYLGKKGLVSELLRSIGNVKKEERAEFGKNVNTLRLEVELKLSELSDYQSRKKTAGLLKNAIDVTAPFDTNTPKNKFPKLISRPGTLHPVTDMTEKALDIFKTMGFHVTEARHLDDDKNVFEALNIPQGHPARDMWDTFWTEDGLIPITHTSSMQNRILSSKDIPIREVIVGKCFRNEATDASHEHTFYQIEGVYVGKNVQLSDLIGTLKSFMNAFYGKDVKYQIQPSYFPFVEPGLEFMIECLVCGQKGCPFCGYSKWVELVPCGMIHPNVLMGAGLDPNEYSGFAWGIGLDRLVMLRSQIEDIRHLHSGDLRFLGQFK